MEVDDNTLSYSTQIQIFHTTGHELLEHYYRKYCRAARAAAGQIRRTWRGTDNTCISVAVQAEGIKALTQCGHVSDFHISAGATLSSTGLVYVTRDTVAVSERDAQRSCKMSSTQCGSKPQPVLLHCKRSTPADGEENLPAASSATPGQQGVHHPAKTPKQTEPDCSTLTVLNCPVSVHTGCRSTPARALPSSSCSSSGAQAKPVSPTLHEAATSSEHSMGWFVTLPPEMLHKLFCLLDHQSLALLSLTSKEMATAVLGYLQSAVGLKHVPQIVPVGHNRSTSLDPPEFRGVGKYSVLFLLVLSPMCA